MLWWTLFLPSVSPGHSAMRLAHDSGAVKWALCEKEAFVSTPNYTERIPNAHFLTHAPQPRFAH